MDEIREITHKGDRGNYSMRIYSDRLKALVRECPDDGEVMHAIGEMYRGKNVDRWYVEYRCTRDKELILSWQPDVDALTKQIAADVLGKTNGDLSPES